MFLDLYMFVLLLLNHQELELHYNRIQACLLREIDHLHSLELIRSLLEELKEFHKLNKIIFNIIDCLIVYNKT